ncbi:MAG: cysteine hydrolase [Herbaspirillum sp.]
MKRNLHLLVIDPQNDFCDLPASHCPANPDGRTAAPSLPVNGAHADMLRLAELINQGCRGLSGISITLDSHHKFDIAHPTFWVGTNGGSVSPFTEITAADVRAGKFLPRFPAALSRTLTYLDALEAAGRYHLMVWPVHCEISTWGHDVHADVYAAYNRWEDSTFGIVNKVTKGLNPWTEHYSAVMAEVPDDSDSDTQLNRGFIDLLRQADCIYIAGEAGSHCVKATTEHIVEQFGFASASKLVLVTDCMSPVEGNEAQYDTFVRDMMAHGVQTATSTDVSLDLLFNAAR